MQDVLHGQIGMIPYRGGQLQLKALRGAIAKAEAVCDHGAMLGLDLIDHLGQLVTKTHDFSLGMK